MGLVDQLIEKAGIATNPGTLNPVHGRTIVCDNYYTSMKLAKHLYDKYKWTIIGTMVPTEKKSPADQDVPFAKLSKGAMRKLNRGWCREACIEMKSPDGARYYIQHTTWKDKKQVTWLNTHRVKKSEGYSVKRYVKGQKERVKFSAPEVHKDYSQYMNGVDRNDRDSRDYSTTIRTTRYYLRISFWALDRVLHAMYQVVRCLAEQEVVDKEWELKRYLSSNGGRTRFQIDVALALMSHGINLEWKDRDGPRPTFMRQTAWVPCNCQECYFCINGLTEGIMDKKKRKADKAAVVYKCGKKRKMIKCPKIGGDRCDLNMKSVQYCRMCYRDRPSTETKNEKRKACRLSKLGCPLCKVPICKSCWPTYEHNI